VCWQAGAQVTPTLATSASDRYTCQASDVLTTEKYTFVKDVLVPAAQDFFQSALSVMPVSGRLMLQDAWPDSYCYGPGVHNSFVCCTGNWDSKYSTAGVADTDFLLVLTSRPISGSTIAWALECQSDQHGRPVAGQANLSPARISTDPKQFGNQLAVLIHEVMHSLGFSANKLGAFRKPGTLDPVSSTTDVLQRFYDPVLGKDVNKIITYNVVKQAQLHYNCFSWPNAGMEVEDYGDAGTAGSHWEKRIAMHDIMNPVSETVMYKSAITLAFFQDSGWYQVDFSAAETLPWGNGEGCDFVQRKCNSWGSRYFCTQPEQMGCTVDLKFQGQCSVQTSVSMTYPAAQQYFTDPRKGGKQPHTDYCPFFAGFSNRDCTDSTTTSYYFYGESPGSSSRCFVGSYQLKNVAAPPQNHSGCLQTTCTTAGNAIQVTLKASGGGSDTVVTCPKAGGYVDLSSLPGSQYSGSLLCPRSDILCRGDACAFNTCNGKGTCQKTDGTCQCVTGYYGSTPFACDKRRCPGYNSTTGVECTGGGWCNSNTGICEDTLNGGGLPGCYATRYGTDCSQIGCPSKLSLCNTTLAVSSVVCPCSGRGTCNQGVCTCAASYIGSDCSFTDCPGSPRCSGTSKGTCDTDSGTCSCKQGMNSDGKKYYYTGADCSELVNGTEPVPVLNFFDELVNDENPTGPRYGVYTNATVAKQYQRFQFNVPSSASPITVTVTFNVSGQSSMSATPFLVAAYESDMRPDLLSNQFEGVVDSVASNIIRIDFVPSIAFSKTGTMVVALIVDAALNYDVKLTRNGCVSLVCKFGECFNGRCICDYGWSGTLCDQPDCPGNPDCGGAGRGVCVVPAAAYDSQGKPVRPSPTPQPRAAATSAITPYCKCEGIFDGLSCNAYQASAVKGSLFGGLQPISGSTRYFTAAMAKPDGVVWFDQQTMRLNFTITGTLEAGANTSINIIDRTLMAGYNIPSTMNLYVSLNQSASPSADGMIFGYRSPVSLLSIPTDVATDWFAWRGHRELHELLEPDISDSTYFVSIHNGLYASSRLNYVLSGELVADGCPDSLQGCNGAGVCQDSMCQCDPDHEGLRCEIPITRVNSEEAGDFPVPAVQETDPLPRGKWQYYIYDLSTNASRIAQLRISLIRASGGNASSPAVFVTLSQSRGRKALGQLSSSAAVYDFNRFSIGAGYQSVRLRREFPQSQRYLYIGIRNSALAKKDLIAQLVVEQFLDSPVTSCESSNPATCRETACNGRGDYIVSQGKGACKCDQGWNADSDCASPGFASFDNIISAAQSVDSLCSVCNDARKYALGDFYIYSIPQTLQKATALSLAVQAVKDEMNLTSGVPAMFVSATLPRTVMDFRYVASVRRNASDGASTEQSLTLDDVSPTGSYWVAIYANSRGKFKLSAARELLPIVRVEAPSFGYRLGQWLIATSPGIVVLSGISILGAILLVLFFLNCSTFAMTKEMKAKLKMMEEKAKQDLVRYNQSMYQLYTAVERLGPSAFNDKPAIKTVASRAAGLRAHDYSQFTRDLTMGLPKKLSNVWGSYYNNTQNPLSSEPGEAYSDGSSFYGTQDSPSTRYGNQQMNPLANVNWNSDTGSGGRARKN
jgi:hypothetical protein